MAMELSLDLVEEILLRVPAQYLVPWRYVCKEWNKQWKALITDPRFVKKHLLHFRCLEQPFTVFNSLIKSTTTKATCKSLSSTVSCVGIDFNELNIASMNLKVLNLSDILVRNMSHCDGLLLLVTPYKLVVLNPLLKEGRWIKSDMSFHDELDVCGLGYTSEQSSSSIWYDYKIVMFRCTSYEKDLRVYIYDFNSDRWKIIVDQTFEGFRGLPKSSVCLRGTPYWLGYDHKYKLLIRSFDFSKERFEPLCLPLESINYVYSLGIYRGYRLSLLRRSRAKDRIDIWVLTKKKKQWSKLIKLVDKPQFRFDTRLRYFIEKKDGKLVISVFQPGNGIVTIYIKRKNKKGQKLKHKYSADHISSECYYVPSLIKVPMPVKVRRKRPREDS